MTFNNTLLIIGILSFIPAIWLTVIIWKDGKANPVKAQKQSATDEIIEAMLLIIRKEYKQALPFAEQLYEGISKEKMLNSIFKFIKSEIRYEPNDPGQQILRTPQRVWSDRHDGVSYADMIIFASSILKCCSVEHKLYFAHFHNKLFPQHVYLVATFRGMPFTMDFSQDAPRSLPEGITLISVYEP